MGVTKKAICLRGFAAVRPYEAARLKLILASSTIVYELSRTAEIKWFSFPTTGSSTHWFSLKVANQQRQQKHSQSVKI